MFEEIRYTDPNISYGYILGDRYVDIPEIQDSWKELDIVHLAHYQQEEGTHLLCSISVNKDKSQIKLTTKKVKIPTTRALEANNV